MRVAQGGAEGIRLVLCALPTLVYGGNRDVYLLIIAPTPSIYLLPHHHHPNTHTLTHTPSRTRARARTNRERQTDRQTDRQTEAETDRQKDRQTETDRDRDRETESQWDNLKMWKM